MNKVTPVQVQAAIESQAPLQSKTASIYPVKILIALHAVMGAVGYVQKKGENKFQNYKYAGEGNLLEALRPAMVENGLLLIPSHREVSTPDVNGITLACVEYTLAHKDGDVWPEKIVVYGAGGDKNSKGIGDKGLYKALTGANKYLLFKLFQIETGDDPEKDAEHDKPESKADPKVVEPDKVKNAPGISEAKTWAREHIRDLENSENGGAFLDQIENFRGRWAKVCAVYPNLWQGPDGSGLRGEGTRLATTFQCRQGFDAFLKEVEALAHEIKNPPAQAAQ